MIVRPSLLMPPFCRLGTTVLSSGMGRLAWSYLVSHAIVIEAM